MTRRRRAAILLGLALVLGTLASTHMSRREAALRETLGPVVDIVVARRELPAGRRLELTDLGVRTLPARYAPPGEPVPVAALAGEKLAVPVASGAPVTASLIARRPQTPEALIARGERAIDLIATGSPQAVVPGARVDVLVTTESANGRRGATRLALEDVEVLAAAAAHDPERAGGPPRMRATLRVTVEQAVYVAAAQSFARDVRLLARALGDRRTAGDLRVDEGL